MINKVNKSGSLVFHFQFYFYNASRSRFLVHYVPETQKYAPASENFASSILNDVFPSSFLTLSCCNLRSGDQLL